MNTSYFFFLLVLVSAVGISISVSLVQLLIAVTDDLTGIQAIFVPWSSQAESPINLHSSEPEVVKNEPSSTNGLAITEYATVDPSTLVGHTIEEALTTEPTTSIISPNPTDTREQPESKSHTIFSVTQPSQLPIETTKTETTLVHRTTETNELSSSETHKQIQGTFVRGPTSVPLTTEMGKKNELCDNYWLFEFLAPRSGSTSVLGALYRQNEMQVTGEIGYLVKLFARIYSELFGLDDSKAGSWKATNLYTDEQIEEARMGYLKQLQFLFKFFAFPGEGEGLKSNFGDSVSHPPVFYEGNSTIVADYFKKPKRVIAFKIIRACDDARVLKFYTEHLFPCAKFIVGGRGNTTGNYFLGPQEDGANTWHTCNKNGGKLQRQSPRKYLAYTKEKDLTPTYLTRLFQWLGVHDSCELANVPYSNKVGFEGDMSPMETKGDCTFDNNKLRDAFPDVNHNWTATKEAPFFNVDASYVNTTTLNQVLPVRTPLQYLVHFLSFLKPISQVCLDDKFQMGLQGQPLESIHVSRFVSYNALNGRAIKLCGLSTSPPLTAWTRNGNIHQPRMNRAITQLLDFMFPSPDASCTDRSASETGRLRLAFGRANTIKGMRYAKLIHPSTRFFSLKSASRRSLFSQQIIKPFRELGLEFQGTIPGRFPHYAEFNYDSVDGLNDLLKFLGVTGCKFLEAFHLETVTKELHGGKLSSTKCEFNRILIKEVKAFDNIPNNEGVIRKSLKNHGYNATSNLVGEVCGAFW